MRYLFLILILSACNTPTREFANAPLAQVQVGKSKFDVRIKNGQAQAIRTNIEFAPNWKYTAARFKTAFEVASGCEIRPNSMVGDQALMQATLDCPGTRPAAVPRRHAGFDCQVVRDGFARNSGTIGPSILCREIVPIAKP